ncbi:hypothetical protein QFZ76_001279 [Streptomyces sp. V4I2]|nr:hypothetical protein [Streptomyces sp. V4I2]
MPARRDQVLEPGLRAVVAGREVALLDLLVLGQLQPVQIEMAAQVGLQARGADDGRGPQAQQERVAVRLGVLRRGRPAPEFGAARGQDLVALLLAARRLLGGQRPDVPLGLQFSQLAIDLLMRRRPEVADRPVEPAGQIEARRRLFEQSGEDRVRE